MEEQRLEQEKRLQEARILELQRQLDRQNLSQLEQKVRNYHLAEEMVSNQRQLLEGGLAIYGVSMTENPREELGRLQSLRNRYDTALSMYHTAKGQRDILWSCTAGHLAVKRKTNGKGVEVQTFVIPIYARRNENLKIRSFNADPSSVAYRTFFGFKE